MADAISSLLKAAATSLLFIAIVSAPIEVNMSEPLNKSNRRGENLPLLRQPFLSFYLFGGSLNGGRMLTTGPQAPSGEEIARTSTPVGSENNWVEKSLELRKLL
jgi:hypothetical protein